MTKHTEYHKPSSVYDNSVLPFVVMRNLEPLYADKWQRQFVKPGRQVSEGLWRRTQEEKTRTNSGWQSAEDARRRILHFMDRYDLTPNNEGKYDFVITDIYLWLVITLPNVELNQYVSRITQALNKCGWTKRQLTYHKDDLILSLKEYIICPEDLKASRVFPSHYRTLELCLTNKSSAIKANEASPWAVLSTGIRLKGNRSDRAHVVNNLEELRPFLPMQVELGGGASIELGIPPLNHMHTVYNVINPETKTFVFGLDDTLISEIIADPKAFYTKKAAEAYTQSLLAKPNIFYQVLAKMHEAGLTVGDIITNNFDGISSLVGLTEKYVRRYESIHIVPKIDFHPLAKSLLVIGNHADRRLIQRAAREQGLKVILVDPEYYIDYRRQAIPYPLEEITANDLLISMTATEFAKKFEATFLRT